MRCAVLCCACRRAEEARRTGIIAEERRKLLVAAADSGLGGFLPPGVLKDAREADLFRQHTQQQQQPEWQQAGGQLLQ